MKTLLTLPFKIIGWLFNVILGLITAILAPAVTLGVVGFLGYKYFEKNPEAFDKVKDQAMSRIMGKKD